MSLTGSEKTTQMPQTTLEDANPEHQSCCILCRQPKRTSVISNVSEL